MEDILDNDKIINYGGKNYFISKFSAFENITFSYKQTWGMDYECSFSCKFDFSGSELILQKYFLVKQFLDEYENKKILWVFPVSFRKRNSAHDFLSTHGHIKHKFIEMNKNCNDFPALFNGFCSEYINWVAKETNSQNELNCILQDAKNIFKKIKNDKENNL